MASLSCCVVRQNMQSVKVPAARPPCSSRGASLIAYNKKGNKRLEVVLTADVDKLGSRGELVSVQNGYMFNYLFPQGLAKKATKDILAEIQAEEDRKQAALDEVKSKAQQMATALKTIGVIKIPKKAGDGDKIFGSVQPNEVVAFIKKQTGRELDEDKMTLPKITQLGTYEGTVQLHAEVIGTFKVQVTRQPN